jgi:hypothetical protein
MEQVAFAERVGYPVQFSVDYPARPFNRLSTAFRIFLVIPIAILLGTVNGEAIQVTAPSRTWGFALVPAGAGGGCLYRP